MEAPVKVGEVLAGKYKVEKVLGAGAMGVVVSARHLDLQQTVALKFMLPSALPDQAAGDRFLREAQAAGRLRGEHVARVMDFGRLDGGAPYIVMEFLDGENLEEVLNREGPFPVSLAAFYIAQACEGMAEAHTQGIVHRDLKPQNLFLTKRPDGSPLVKVLDFGISKLQGDISSVTATQSTAVMGSPAYMSPEQARSAKKVDSRGDIYSLGAILYQLVSGVLPYAAESVAGMLVAIVSEPPIPLREVLPDVPPDFEALVLQCLEKDRDKRPQTARELGAALSPFSSQRTSLWDGETERVTGQNLGAQAAKAPVKAGVITTMEPSSRPNQPSADAKIQTPSLAASLEPARPRSRAAVIGGAAFAILCVVGVGVGYAATRPSKTAQAVPITATSVETATTNASVAPPPPASAMAILAASAQPSATSSAPASAALAPSSITTTSAPKASSHSRADAGAPHVGGAASAPPATSKPAGGLFDRPE
ncbi:MAG: serine/threonine-protein kinase [Polyangiaceae bacterium]